MTQHDTPEAVEAMALGVERTFYSAAGMLRRLHRRAVDAEWERDQAHLQASEVLLIDELNRLRAALASLSDEDEVATLRASLATARADALRHAVFVVDSTPTADGRAAQAIMSRLRSLINKEPRHD